MNHVGKPWSDSLAQCMVLMRQMKRLGLREYARELKLSPATLSRIEHGKGCDVDTLVLIAKATGVDYNVLLGGTAQNGTGDA